MWNRSNKHLKMWENIWKTLIKRKNKTHELEITFKDVKFSRQVCVCVCICVWFVFVFVIDYCETTGKISHSKTIPGGACALKQFEQRGDPFFS